MHFKSILKLVFWCIYTLSLEEASDFFWGIQSKCFNSIEKRTVRPFRCTYSELIRVIEQGAINHSFSMKNFRSLKIRKSIIFDNDGISII